MRVSFKTCSQNDDSYSILLVVEVNWQRTEYTVQEEEGEVEVCFTRSLTVTFRFPAYIVQTFPGTAQEGEGRLLSDLLATLFMLTININRLCCIKCKI